MKTRRKSLFKRGLSFFIAMTMCLSMLQMPVFAAETHEHNQDGWECVWTEGSEELNCKHEHDEECYTPGKDVLDCEDDHHSEECYGAGEDILICEDDGEEHEHNEDCYAPGDDVLKCKEKHHTEDCYIPGEDELNCSHEHNEDCYIITEGKWNCMPGEIEETENAEDADEVEADDLAAEEEKGVTEEIILETETPAVEISMDNTDERQEQEDESSYATEDELAAAFEATGEALEDEDAALGITEMENHVSVKDFMDACDAIGDADDIESILAALDKTEAVYHQLSDKDKEVVADEWAYIQGYMENIRNGNPDEELGGLALISGESFTVNVVKVVNGNAVDSVTLTQKCLQSTGHSGYNHSTNLRTLANVSGFSGYKGYNWSKYTTVPTSYKKGFAPNNNYVSVHYNITGSAPYKANETLFLFFEEEKIFTLNYDANGGTGAPESQTAKSTADKYDFTISSVEPTRDGYTFLGWGIDRVNPNKYFYANNKITVESTTTLYAIWEVSVEQVTLTYHGNGNTGGRVPASQTVNKGENLTIKNAGSLVRTGYIFLGWDAEQNAAEPSWSPGDSMRLVQNTDLYAVWKPDEGRPTIPGTKPGSFTVIKSFDGLAEGVLIPDITLTYEAWRTKDGEIVGKKETGKVEISPSGDGCYSGTITPTVWDIQTNGAGSMSEEERSRYKNVIVVTEANAEVEGYNLEFAPQYPADGTAEGSQVTFSMDGATFKKNLSLKNIYTQIPDTPKPSLDNLDIIKSVDRPEVNVGEDVTYTIKVENNASQSVEVDIVDQLPNELFTGAPTASDGGVYNEDTCSITWEKVNIEANGFKELTVTVKTARAGSFENIAEIVLGDKKKTDKVTVVVKEPKPLTPSLEVTKKNDGFKIDSQTGNATVKYTITVTNTSGFPIYGLRITDTLEPPTITKVNTEDTGEAKIKWSFKDFKTKTSDNGRFINITPTGGEEDLVHVLQPLNRGEEFADKQTVTLTYKIEIENLNDDVAVKVKLDNTALGASWSKAPTAEQVSLFRMSRSTTAPLASDDEPDISASDSSSASSGEIGGNGSSSTEGELPGKYSVIYTWNLPEGADETLPAESKYPAGAAIKVDNNYTNTTTTVAGGRTYTFSGWSTDDVEVKNGGFIMPAKNVIIRGTWEKKEEKPDTPDVPDAEKITATWLPGYGDNQPIQTEEYSKGTTKVPEEDYPENPEREGYTFDGWGTPVTDENGNITITAQWKPVSDITNPESHKVTIHYLYTDGSKAADDAVRDSLTEGTAYSITSPGIDGYTPDQAVVEGTMGTEDIEITVIYTRNSTGSSGGSSGGGSGSGGSSGGGGGGSTATNQTGRVHGTTPAPESEVTVPGDGVPLAVIPEGTDIPDEDVPLAGIPVVDIPDADVPLAGIPDLMYIPDDDVPLASVPKTGDNSGLWHMMALLSAFSLMAVTMMDRKKRQEKEK